jgi:hypothetical protein
VLPIFQDFVEGAWLEHYKKGTGRPSSGRGLQSCGQTAIEADVHVEISATAIAEPNAKIHTHRRKAKAWAMLAAVKKNANMPVPELMKLLGVKERYVYDMRRVLERCPEQNGNS